MPKKPDLGAIQGTALHRLGGHRGLIQAHGRGPHGDATDRHTAHCASSLGFQAWNFSATLSCPTGLDNF